MPIPKTKQREAIFQILFCLDAGHAEKNDIVKLIMEELKITKTGASRAFDAAHAIYEKKEEIDGEIGGIATSYSIDRIQSVEKNILRLGVYELLYDKSIPPLVAIAEAMRLANKFSDKEACKFINAILDAVLKKTTGDEGGV